MDRESSLTKDHTYTALIGAYDNGKSEPWLSLWILFSALLSHQNVILIWIYFWLCFSLVLPDAVPATGTGTLIIQLQDVNDNAPIVEERSIRVCLFF